MIGQRFITIVAAALAVLHLAHAFECTADCSGGAGENCQTCSTGCGNCDAVEVITHCHAAGVVHMSFDDGPNDYSTQVLDLLKARNIKASFWLIGQQIAGREAMVQRMFAEGHHIGDHTWTHPSLNNLTVAEITSELSQCKTAIEATVPGYTVTTMRPPSGDLNTPARTTAQGLGLTPVMWNLDSEDWRGSVEWEVGNVTNAFSGISRAAQSFLILSHPNTALAFGQLGWLLDQVTLAGYKFVSFNECTDANAVTDPSLVPTGAASLPECVHASWVDAYDIQCGNGVGCGQSGDGSISCCSVNGYCGAGPDFCGTGCKTGGCYTCGAAGFIPYLNRTQTASSTGSSSTSSTGAQASTGSAAPGSSGAAGSSGSSRASSTGSAGIIDSLPSSGTTLQILPALLLLPAAAIYLNRRRLR